MKAENLELWGDAEYLLPDSEREVAPIVPQAQTIGEKAKMSDTNDQKPDCFHSNDETNEVEPVVSAFATWSKAACVRKFWRLYLTGLGISLAGMYSGYANSVIGSIVVNQGFIDQFGTVRDQRTGALAVNSEHISLWGSLYFVTSILIQVVAPTTADRFGRKFNMWGVTFFLTLAILVQCFAKNWWTLLIARLLAGFAGGLMGTSCMVYMSEISLPQFRGSLLGSFSLAFSFGQLFLALAIKILQETSPLKFRNIFYSEFVFCGLWLVPMLWIPESPVWYCSTGQHEKGKAALRRLVGNVEGYDVEHEYAVLQYENEKSKALTQALGTSDWRAFFRPVNIKRTIASALPFTFQNVCGVPLMFGYTTYFFSLAGVDDPFLATLIQQILLLVGICTSFYLVDRVGRRSLVLWGGALLAIICIVVGGLGFLEMTTSTGAAMVALCSLWAFVYANSLAPIGWISLVEISSPQLRAKTSAVAVTIQYVTGILFFYTVPLMLSEQNAGWGQKIGLFFGGLTAVYLIPCIFFFPEVKGRTYGELDELFERGVPAWRFASTQTEHDAQKQRLSDQK